MLPNNYNFYYLIINFGFAYKCKNVPISSFDQIFIRELSALYKPNDTVFILSTSGNSQNVIKVAEYVRSIGGNALSLIGKDGGQLKHLTDNFIIPFSSTSLIQELQFLIGHSICDELEKYVVRKPKND